MKFRHRLAAAALALGGAALSACASVDRAEPFNEFASGRYRAARTWYEDDLSRGVRDETLDRCEAGTVALVQGDVEAAHRHFEEAFNSMQDLSSTTGESALAVIGPESGKTWKGDPYERCMDAYYLGVTYWLMGDPDNAAACFKAGVLLDADSEKGAAQSDFALLWFLEGMAQREAHHEDGGAAALAKAHALLPDNRWLDPAKNADANVLVVVDMGLGPQKVASGPHGSQLRFRQRRYGAAYAEVSADGAPLGRTQRAVDVHFQATTRGGKVIDHINAGKAVFKDAAVIGGIFALDNSRSESGDLFGLALIALGLLTPAEADDRFWSTLPGEVQVLTAKLPPGEHDLRVEVKDRTGASIVEETKKLHVVVRESGTTFAWTRAMPGERGVAVGKSGYVESVRMEAKP